MSDTPNYWRTHRPFSETSNQMGCFCQNLWGEAFYMVTDSETGECSCMSNWYHAWHNPDPAPYSWLGPTREVK